MNHQPRKAQLTPRREHLPQHHSPNGFTTTTGLCIWFKKQLAEHNPDIRNHPLEHRHQPGYLCKVHLPTNPTHLRHHHPHPHHKIHPQGRTRPRNNHHPLEHFASQQSLTGGTRTFTPTRNKQNHAVAMLKTECGHIGAERSPTHRNCPRLPEMQPDAFSSKVITISSTTHPHPPPPPSDGDLTEYYQGTGSEKKSCRMQKRRL